MYNRIDIMVTLILRNPTSICFHRLISIQVYFCYSVLGMDGMAVSVSEKSGDEDDDRDSDFVPDNDEKSDEGD